MYKPRQRIPESEKDRAFRRNTLQYYFQCKMYNFFNYKDIDILELTSGKLKMMNYRHVTNPFNLQDTRYHRYPAKLINYDFLTPLFRRMLAEYSQRVFEPVVYTKNSNFENEQLEYEKNLINESLQQRFINSIIQSGLFDPNQLDEYGNPVEPPMSPDVIGQKKSSLKDIKTITGQHAINYIVDKQRLELKYRKAWEYYIKLNKCFTFKTVRRDQVVLEVISPLHVRYYGNRNIIFLEDCEAIRVDYLLTYEEVLEIFQDTFKEKEYMEEYGDLSVILEDRSNHSIGIPSGFTNSYFYSKSGINTNYSISEDTRILVTHIQFTSFRKVGKVLSETGEIITVTEDYVGDDVLEWTYEPEEREGYVIDSKYYIGGYANDIQIVDADNPFSTKKNYNGRIFMQGDIEQLTLGEALYQYQEAYNICKFKLQSTINKNKDKLMVMPLGLINGLKNTGDDGDIRAGDFDNREEDLLDPTNKNIYQYDRINGNNNSEESATAKALYYADATQMLFVDETSENAALAAQMIKDIDLSLGNYIQYLMSYCAAIKQEAEELIGFNRFRTGGIRSSDSVGTTQEAVYSGSLITEEFFTSFEEFLTSEFQGILDRSKYAFRTGFTSNYVRNRTDIEVLKIDEGFPESSYGVFIRPSAKTKAVLDELKAQTTQLLQNGMANATSLVARILSGSENFASIIQDIEQMEEEMIQREQSNAQADRENQLAIEQLRAEESQKDRDLKEYEINMKAQTEIMKFTATGQSFALGREDGDADAATIVAEGNKMIAHVQDIILKREELKQNERNNKRDNETKRYVADKNFSIAKENKNK